MSSIFGGVSRGGLRGCLTINPRSRFGGTPMPIALPYINTSANAIDYWVLAYG
jgi:hypothetical protein